MLSAESCHILQQIHKAVLKLSGIYLEMCRHPWTSCSPQMRKPVAMLWTCVFWSRRHSRWLGGNNCFKQGVCLGPAEGNVLYLTHFYFVPDQGLNWFNPLSEIKVWFWDGFPITVGLQIHVKLKVIYYWLLCSFTATSMDTHRSMRSAAI